MSLELKTFEIVNGIVLSINPFESKDDLPNLVKGKYVPVLVNREGASDSVLRRRLSYHLANDLKRKGYDYGFEVTYHIDSDECVASAIGYNLKN
ncbi:MAG: hypothetical protein Q8Q35_01520 [Nanoarchaeota archaeon]|nr:hypothetical protein [Nanoarchaeota archaeon]